MQSTMLVSGFDSLFVSTEGVFDFASSGAGLLAHTAIQRNLYYLTQLYPEFSHNIMSYFSNTKYDNFSSVDNFFKKNGHSHFTTGITEMLVFKRINSSSTLKLKVYGVDESNSLEFNYLDELVESASKVNIKVEIDFIAEAYFKHFVVTTVVIEDEYDGKAFNVQDYTQKVNIINGFVVNKLFGTSSEVKIKKNKNLEIQ